MEPGIYRKRTGSGEHLTKWHTDHWEFHYLNTDGNWADIGWGQPWDETELELVPSPERLRAAQEAACDVGWYRGLARDVFMDTGEDYNPYRKKTDDS